MPLLLSREVNSLLERLNGEWVQDLGKVISGNVTCDQDGEWRVIPYRI